MPDPRESSTRSWVHGVRDTSINVGMTLFTRFPRLNRSLQCLVQDLAPTRIHRLGGAFIVTAFEDACEVLERDHDFVVGPMVSPKLHTGPFPLGMDDSPQYRVERDLIERALSLPLPPDTAVALARDALSRLNLAASGRFDAVARYGQIVPSLFVERVLGLPLPQDPRPELRLAEWLRNLAIPIAMGHPAPLWVRPRIARSRDAFMKHVSAAVDDEARRQREGGSPIGTSLSQAVGTSLRDGIALEDTCRVLAGTILTSHAVVTKAFAHVLRHLLTHPKILERACKTTLDLDVDRAHQTLRAIIAESLRFDPVFPMLGRFAPRATLLARGTKRETLVPAGARVIVGALGAMFDPGALDQPDVFDEERWVVRDTRELVGTPVDLLFSRSRHRCPGSFLALELLYGMVSVVISLPELRRSRRGGSLGYWLGTPAVKRLNVEFG